MVYNNELVQNVDNGTNLHYILQGQPTVNANLKITLHVRFVRVQGGETGVVIDKEKSTIPEGVSLSSLTEDDVIHTLVDNVLTKVWLTSMNGPALRFQGDLYPLFHTEAVNDQGGRVYFTFLPVEFGNGTQRGHIVHNEEMWLE